MQRNSDLRIIHLLQQFEKEGKKAMIGGPPFWLDRILERMKKDGIKLNLKHLEKSLRFIQQFF